VLQLDQREFGEMLSSTHPSAKELAKRLAEMVRLADDPTQFDPLVAYVYSQRGEQPAIAEMFTLLAASSETPPALTATMGTVAALGGDLPEARRLLAAAVEAEPDNAVAWNNYAWALSREPDGDLDRALAAVNRALELTPTEFRFRETGKSNILQ
jgi:tetratricopeptide (TPR) repeat protein